MGMCLPMTWSAMSWTVAEDLFSVFSRHSLFALPIFLLLSCASSLASPDFFKMWRTLPFPLVNKKNRFFPFFKVLTPID